MVKATAKTHVKAFQPDYAVHPGEVLGEWLIEQGMTQNELAIRIGMSSKALNQMIKGHVPVTPETSLRLENTTGIPARIWNSFQVKYDETVARLNRDASFRKDAELLKQVPMNALRKRGYVVSARTDTSESVREVCSFFGVADAKALNTLWHGPIATRQKCESLQVGNIALATWLRIGEISSRGIEAPAFSRSQLRKSIPDICSLITKSDISKVMDSATEICSKAGVVLLEILEVDKSHAASALQWVGKRPVIQVSLRQKSVDQLMRNLLHQIGHILFQGRRQEFVAVKQGAKPELFSVEKRVEEFVNQQMTAIQKSS